MRNAFLVFAHDDPRTSFNAALKDVAAAELSTLGYSVTISDLYAQDFDARAPRDKCIGDMLSGESVPCITETKECLSPKIRDEISKVKAADLVIFQFPMYWFGPPAILRRWFDKVFSPEEANRYPIQRNNKGIFKRQQAMFSVTTRALKPFHTYQGLNSDRNEMLFSKYYGILKCCGFEVLKHQIFYTEAFPADGNDRKTMLQELRIRLQRLDDEAPIKFVPTHSFDLQTCFTMKEELWENYRNETKGRLKGNKLQS